MQKEKEMNNTIAVYPGVDAELVEAIRSNAESLGLNRIDYGKRVHLEKMGEKNRSPYNYPKKYKVAENANLQIVGNEDKVWLYLFGMDMWFKTSPIVRVEQLESVDEYSIFQIETENSIYQLSQRQSE